LRIQVFFGDVTPQPLKMKTLHSFKHLETLASWHGITTGKTWILRQQGVCK